MQKIDSSSVASRGIAALAALAASAALAAARLVGVMSVLASPTCSASAAAPTVAPQGNILRNRSCGQRERPLGDVNRTTRSRIPSTSATAGTAGIRGPEGALGPTSGHAVATTAAIPTGAPNGLIRLEDVVLHD